MKIEMCRAYAFHELHRNAPLLAGAAVGGAGRLFEKINDPCVELDVQTV